MGTKLKQRGNPPNLLPSEKFFVSNTPSHRKTSSFASTQKKEWRKASSSTGMCDRVQDVKCREMSSQFYTRP